RVVLGVVDESALGVRRDNDRRHARARPPTVAGRRRDVVPGAAVLVVGDDDRAVLPVRAVLHRANEALDVLLAAQQARVAGVLVILAKRRDERHRRERVVLQRGEEFGLVAQVDFLRLGAVGVIGEEGERLVVILEEGIGVTSQRVVPAAREP